jgi:hypothetical protein
MSRTLMISIAALALLGLRPGAAASPTAEVAVAALTLDAVDVPAEAAQVLTEALRQRLRATPGVRLLPGKDLVEVKLVFGCLDEKPACLAQAGRSLGADRLLFGSVRKPAGPGYTVVLKQLGVGSGRIEKFISDVVPQRVFHKESTELAQLVKRWLDIVLISGLRGGVQITTEPPGAEVVLDGMRVGKAPLILEDVLTGSHVAEITLPGYEKVVRSFTVPGGMVHTLNVTLAPRGQKAPRPLIEVPPPTEPARRGHDPGRPLRIASYFLLGAAALAGGVSIYTWRTYVNDQEPARSALDVLQMRFGNASPEVSEFFRQSDRLSSCHPPDRLVMDAMADPMTATAYNNYMDHCRHGRTYAAATTGLVATMGSLALLGVATYIVGYRLGRPGHKTGPDDAYKRASWLYTPRLQAIAPTASAQGGGVNLSFQF